MLEAVLEDEPNWRDLLHVEPIELANGWTELDATRTRRDASGLARRRNTECP